MKRVIWWTVGALTISVCTAIYFWSAMDWHNLLSGCLGSIVGAAATILATYVTIEETVKVNDKNAEKQEASSRQAIWRGLLSCIKQNIKILKNILPGGMNPNVRLEIDFWRETKGNLHYLPITLQNNLIDAFSLIGQHNDLVIALSHAQGNYDTAKANINQLKTQIEPTLTNLDKQLEEFLLSQKT